MGCCTRNILGLSRHYVPSFPMYFVLRLTKDIALGFGPVKLYTLDFLKHFVVDLPKHFLLGCQICQLWQKTGLSMLECNGSLNFFIVIVIPAFIFTFGFCKMLPTVTN